MCSWMQEKRLKRNSAILPALHRQCLRLWWTRALRRPLNTKSTDVPIFRRGRKAYLSFLFRRAGTCFEKSYCRLPDGRLFFVVRRDRQRENLRISQTDSIHAQSGKSSDRNGPEISLTAQTIRQFQQLFGDEIAVFHSGLSLGERLDEWKRVHRGEAQIVVGTRSAVFAPVQNLGLIVIDEEQEHTYQSESSPRYDAREVARYRCYKAKALCLLSSATPSAESCRMAQEKKYRFHQLTARFGEAQIPNVELIDMNEETPDGTEGESVLLLRRPYAAIMKRGINPSSCSTAGDTTLSPLAEAVMK